MLNDQSQNDLSENLSRMDMQMKFDFNENYIKQGHDFKNDEPTLVIQT
jgi:hypothetical protein